MGRYGFKDLQVWKESKDLAAEIYNLTSFGEINRDFDLRSQIRRAAISVPSNIAEGDERGTDKEAVRFFNKVKKYRKMTQKQYLNLLPIARKILS